MKKFLNVLNLGFHDYGKTLELQRELASLRGKGTTLDMLILAEHNPVYTLGRGGKKSNLLLDSESLKKKGIEFFEVERGGDITYHGPGQIVAYPIFDLNGIEKDIHRFLRNLEEVLLLLLEDYGIFGERIRGKTGVWVGKEKIASIGVKISRWITWHGLALNVNPDLSYFNDIVLCGLKNVRSTSMAKELGTVPDIDEVKESMIQCFAEVFGFSATFPFLFAKKGCPTKIPSDLSE
jgi:lipoate-protein ligase B